MRLRALTSGPVIDVAERGRIAIWARERRLALRDACASTGEVYVEMGAKRQPAALERAYSALHPDLS